MSLKDKIRVTIVDDMSVSRALLIQSLEEIGIKNLDFYRSGVDAYPKIVASPPHLVISDFNMPVMDGLQLLNNLRSNVGTQRIGFILVTGSPNQSIIDRGKRLGLNNILPKPFTNKTLLASIEAVVGRL